MLARIRSALVILPFIGLLAVFPVAVPGPWLDPFFPSGTEISYFGVKAWLAAGLLGVLVLIWAAEAQDVDVKGLHVALRGSRTWVQLLFVAIASMTVATLLRTESSAIALIGTAARMDGSLTVGMTLLFAPVTYYVLRSRPSTAKVVLWVALLGSLAPAVWMSLVGLGVLASRVPGSGFAHPSLAGGVFATWLMVAVGIGMSFRPSTGLHWAALVATPVYVLALVVSGGRAGLLAASGMLVVSVVWVWLGRWGSRRQAVRVALLVVISMAGALVLPQQGRSTVASLDRVASNEDQSFNARLITWRAGISVALRHPILGVGLGGFSSAVWSAVPPESEPVLYREFVRPAPGTTVERYGTILAYIDQDGVRRFYGAQYDRAHNAMLDFALSYGGVSLLVLAVAWVIVLVQLIRSRNDGAVAIAVGLLTYAIFMQAWFWSIQVAVPVYVLLGLGAALAEEPSPAPGKAIDGADGVLGVSNAGGEARG